MMLEATRHGWAIALRGALAIVLGILFLVWPGASLGALVLLFGTWAFLDGVTALAAAITHRGRGELALEGVVGIAVGLLTWLRPGGAALALYVLAVIWVLATGTLKIVAAVRLRHVVHHELWLGLSGALSLLFGVLMLASPGLGAMILATWLGIYAIFFGAAMVAFAFRLRTARELGV